MIKLISISLFALFVAYACSEKAASVRALPIGQSIPIIVATSGLLANSCIPDCWPRDFSKKERTAEQYTAYVQQKIFDRDSTGRQKIGKLNHLFPEIDSSFHHLIDETVANYSSIVGENRITIEDVRSLNGEKIRVGVIDGLKESLGDNELGYLQLSPVFLDSKGNKGVYFYQLFGEVSTTWLVCIRRNNNEWSVVSKTRLAIS